MDLVINRTGLEKKFHELCSKVVGENGFEIYDLDYLPQNKTLRLYIMNPQTKSAIIEDCVLIDRALTPYFDELDWVPEPLTLEVSSPGLFRNLREYRHFDLALKENIEVFVRGELDKKMNSEVGDKVLRQKKYQGLLESFDESKLVLNTSQGILNIHWDGVKKAQLDPDWREATN